MLSAFTLAARFREGDDFGCEGRYRSRETVQAWVVACAAKHPLRMMDVQAELKAVTGGDHAARKFRAMCGEFLAAVADAKRKPDNASPE